MESSAHIYWLVFGGILVFAEFLLPGLVSVFVGLGAITVAGLLYTHLIESLAAQSITFFASATLYIFTLRLAVMQIYPSDTDVQNVDEDATGVGDIATVVEGIPAGGAGRISYGGTTWQAKATGGVILQAGEKVSIVERDNITWVVKQSESGDS